MSEAKELPEYVCHKRVRAAKISRVVPTGGSELGFALEFEDGSTRAVSAEYMSKHHPRVGGWFVLYADGYESFSPDEAFSDGYTRVG